MCRFFQTAFILLQSVAFSSCNSPDNAGFSNSKPMGYGTQPLPLPPASFANVTEGDPAFEVMKDTVSLFGPHNITRNVLQDRNGNLWLASWAGIICYDGKFFTNVTLKSGLQHYHIMSLLEDKTGNLWFGTVGGGVYRYRPSVPVPQDPSHPKRVDGEFTLFTVRDGLADNVVLCMLEDRAGKIWFGTKAGVSCYDPSAVNKGHMAFTSYTTKNGLSDNFVCTLAEDKAGILWLGTNGGISCCPSSLPLFSNSSGPSDQALFASFNIAKDTSFHLVRSIVEDHNGKIWIGSAEGLYRYEPGNLPGKNRAITRVTKNGIYYIFEDDSGILWLSGEGLNNREMSLFRCDNRHPENNHPEKLLTRITSDLQVFGITQDRNGSIWYGTAEGICRIDAPQAKSISITRFTEPASDP
jgi:ligand-binding sensor domain-containing protein